MHRLIHVVKQRMTALLWDCSGPTATEYAIMLALIILVAMGSIKAIGLDWEEKIFVQLARAVPS